MNNVVELFKPMFNDQAVKVRSKVTERLNNRRNALVSNFSVNDFVGVKTKDIWDFLVTKDVNGESIAAKAYEIIQIVGLVKAFNPELFNREVELIVNATIAYNEAKLTEAISDKLGNLDVVKVSEIFSRVGAKGIEGSYRIHLADGDSGLMETNAIHAGGYNIQCFHYRYLIKVSDNLEAKANASKSDVSALSEIELALMTAVTKSELEDRCVPDLVIYRATDNLKGKMRNWNPLVKKGFLFKYEYGNYCVKRYKYQVTKLGMELIEKLK